MLNELDKESSSFKRLCGTRCASSPCASASVARTFGMRRISHAALLIFTALSAIGFFIALAGKADFATAYGIFTIVLMMFAVIATNFTAISLEPMGNLAGTATAVTGFVSTTFGALLGGGVGQLFNGTVQPLFGGFAFFGMVTIAATLWAENGKLFSHPGDSPQLDPGAAHF